MQVTLYVPSHFCLVLISSFSSLVDGDPHFVVQLPNLSHNLCFTVDGRENDVLRLLEDPERGVSPAAVLVLFFNVHV